MTPQSTEHSKLTKLMNVSALKKIDEKVVSVITEVPFVRVHVFLPENQEWKRCPLAGPMFVCKRSSQNRKYSIIILSQEDSDDFVDYIVPDMRIGIYTKSFYIYRPSDEKILSYNVSLKHDLDRIYSILRELIIEISSARAKQKQNISLRLPVDFRLSIDLKSPDSLPNTPSAMSDGVKKLFGLESANVSNPNYNSGLTFIKGSYSAADIEKRFFNELKKSESPKKKSDRRTGDSVQQCSVGIEKAGFPKVDDEISKQNVSQQSEVLSSGNTTLRSTGDLRSLSKEQMIEAVSYLLKTDDSFVTKLHQAYVDAMNERLGLSNISK